MSNSKLSIRPNLNLSSVIPDEDFQNKTLRPVLKLQNAIVVQLFLHHTKKRKLDTSNKEEVFEVVQKTLQKDLVLKNKLIGSIVGLFTEEELKEYQIKESEFNKRILNMLAQRISDNLNKE